MKPIVSLIAAAALVGCASSASDQNAAQVSYEKYSCSQIGAIRGDYPDPVQHGEYRRDMAALERASIEKGCGIEFR